MDIDANTLPELFRIFSFFNSHSNKLYQEGYFLKFHDTDSRTFKLHIHNPRLCY
jgi:CCR4-NOT transcriptional complex subunit CAF120